MQIFIKVLTGGVVTLNVKGDQKVADLKAQIADSQKIDPKSQQLVYAGAILEDDKKLSDYDIAEETTLFLINSPATGVASKAASGATPKPAQIQVVVVQDNNRTTIDIALSARVAELKKEITSRGGPAAGGFALMYSGEPMDDKKTLADCGVVDKGCVQVTVIARGGC